MSTPEVPAPLYTLDWSGTTPGSTTTPPSWHPDRAPGAPHAYGVVDTPTRWGDRAARFELRPTDALAVPGRSKRTEFNAAPEPVGADRWYGFSIRLDQWAADPSAEILTQWHQADSADRRFWGSPPLSLGVRGPNWEIARRRPSWDDVQSHDTVNVPVAPWSTGWADWVFHVVWSDGPDGLVVAWLDGCEVFRFAGQNKFADGSGNFLKFGIYKWDWRDGAPPGTPPRVIQYDELRIADGSGGRTAVSPPDVRAVDTRRA